MFLSWSLIKRQNTFFYDTFILKFELMYWPEIRVDMTQPMIQRNHRRSISSCTSLIYAMTMSMSRNSMRYVRAFLLSVKNVY